MDSVDGIDGLVMYENEGKTTILLRSAKNGENTRYQKVTIDESEKTITGCEELSYRQYVDTMERSPKGVRHYCKKINPKPNEESVPGNFDIEDPTLLTI